MEIVTLQNHSFALFVTMLSSISVTDIFKQQTVVNLKNAIFWDVALCGSCVNRRFGGTYRHHLHGSKNCKLLPHTLIFLP
jgi:hypothetical protein